MSCKKRKFGFKCCNEPVEPRENLRNTWGHAKTTQKESRPGNQTHNLLADFCDTAVLRHVVDMAQIQLKILGSGGGSGCLSRVESWVESRVKVQAEGPGWSPGPNPSWTPGWRWPLSDVPSWCPGVLVEVM